MAIIPAEVKEAFETLPYVTLCTASAAGQPNANIIGMKFFVDDETVYLSDQFFKKTLANIQENPKICVSMCDGKASYEMYGTARYVNEGEEYETMAAKANAIFEKIGMPITSKGGIYMTVTAVYNESAGPEAGAQMA